MNGQEVSIHMNTADHRQRAELLLEKRRAERHRTISAGIFGVLIATGAVLASTRTTSVSTAAARVPVFGHYPGYAAGHLPVKRIRYDMLTHVSYFSLLTWANGNLDTSEVDDDDLAEMVAHADANDVRTIIVVGGWGRSTHFAKMAADPDARANFAANLLQYCRDRKLDGADLDWEPVSTVKDRMNYSLLVEAVHDAFEPFGLSLSIAVSAYGHEITPEAIAFVDFLNVMAYDGEPPLHSTFDFAVSALKHWEDYGAPREKLMLGVPFYGRSANGAGYSYRDIVQVYHPGTETDLIGGIGFSGVSTTSDKTAYAMGNGYRGIMIWEISQDTTDGSSLLEAISDTIASSLPANLNGAGGVDFNDFQILASAWHSEPNDSNWNPLCDISPSQASVIDSHDLAAFCADWLNGR